MATIREPFGAQIVETIMLSATGTQALVIVEQLTFIDGVTTQATGNRTINLTIGAGVNKGAKIHVSNKTAGTETTIFGIGITAATITGVAGKTKVVEFTYNGTAFIAVGENQQVD